MPVTRTAIRNAHEIFGKDVASLRGKTRQRTMPAVESVRSDLAPQRKDQTLHGDIMFVDKSPFLISISTPLHVLAVTHLTGYEPRSKKNVISALTAQTAVYKSYGFNVNRIMFDGEKGVSSGETDLNILGIKVEQPTAGEHVPLVENAIRNIKERIRCHICALSFQCFGIVLVWLVMFCVNRINITPTKAYDKESTGKERLTGVKVNFLVDLATGFGEAIQAWYPRTQVNSMEMRVHEGISLGPVGTKPGETWVLNTVTWEVEKRSRLWVVLMRLSLRVFLLS